MKSHHEIELIMPLCYYCITKDKTESEPSDNLYYYCNGQGCTCPFWANNEDINMTKYLTLLFNNYIQRYIFPHEEESDQDHRNLHLKKIQLAGQDIQNNELPIDKRVDAAHRLGILGYTGGYAAAKGVGKFMPMMVDFLKSPDLSDAQIVTVLQALSGVCHVHVANQLVASALGLLNILQHFISPASQLSTKAKFWSCYLINILCCNNIPVIRNLRSSPNLQVNLEGLHNLNWIGWQKNYAEELLYILGFWQPIYKA